MDAKADPLDPDAVVAMFAVAEGTASMDAWLEYVRAHHPTIVDVLATAAMTEMAIDLLHGCGDITHEEAVMQRREAATTAAAMLPPGALRQVLALKQRLETMQSRSRGDEDVPRLVPDGERSGSSAALAS
jgi:hypothetical protein